MPRPSEPIIKHVPIEELNGLLNRYSSELDTPAKARKAEKRVTLIRMRYNGDSIQKCAQSLGITQRTCYNIQNEWNEKGTSSIVPGTSTGAKPKLNQEMVDDIKRAIRESSMTVKETTDYIRENTDTELSENQVRRIFHNDVRKQRNRK